MLSSIRASISDTARINGHQSAINSIFDRLSVIEQKLGIQGIPQGGRRKKKRKTKTKKKRKTRRKTKKKRKRR
tara:strand:- start:3009 stop:3227 length:219 start_codon:yes stop_codon:yes gene_type:complete